MDVACRQWSMGYRGGTGYTSRSGNKEYFMEPGFNLFSVILLLGAAHGLFLALALLNARGGNMIAHRILAFITLIFVFDLSGEVLYQTGYYASYPHLLWIDDPLEFLYGPLVLFYVQTLTNPSGFRLTRRHGLHFLPVFLACILSAPFYTLNSAQKLQFVTTGIELESTHLTLAAYGQIVLALVFVVQVAIYIILSIRLLARHARRIRDNFSYTERVSLLWLRNMLGFLTVLLLLFVVELFAADALGINEKANDALYLLVVIMVYTMGYLGLRQPAIFSHPEPANQNVSTQEDFASSDPEPVAIEEKYKASALDADSSRLFLDELTATMENEKLYLDVKLTLPQLATHLGLSTNYLSQVINEQLDKNFFDYVNTYRVEAAKNALVSTAREKINILNIAYDSGFNSKSAFYTAFRKNTGTTPSQFRKIAVQAKK